MQSVSFSKNGNTTLTFDTNPTYPFGDVAEINVAVRRTAGNSSRRYYKGVDASHIVLVWTKENPLSKDVYDGGYNYATRTQDPGTQSLRNWFDNVGVGPLNNFTYTNQNNVVRTAYFEQGVLEPQQDISLGFVGALLIGVEYPFNANASSSTLPPSSSSSAWNGAHYTMGSYHLWFDATGALRYKSGAPASDTDGSLVMSSTATSIQLLDVADATPVTIRVNNRNMEVIY